MPEFISRDVIPASLLAAIIDTNSPKEEFLERGEYNVFHDESTCGCDDIDGLAYATEHWRVIQGPNYGDLTILGPNDIELEVYASDRDSYTVEDLELVAGRVAEVLEANWNVN